MRLDRPLARLRALTGTLSTRCSGAGAILTVTTALLAVLTRTPGSAIPTITLERTSDFADPTHTGSVMASVTRRSTLSGPITSTVGGSAEISPTINPLPGSPSTDGLTGTTRVADGSNRIATEEGVTCVTVTANGPFTRSGET